jgi:acyl-coenzyme A synthetase/AMP-(fatty) acid ligase
VDGFRIELAEIEAVYASHPLVEQAVAVVRENRLGVFIRARTTVGLSRSDEAALWDHASRSLTHYMLPK